MRTSLAALLRAAAQLLGLADRALRTLARRLEGEPTGRVAVTLHRFRHASAMVGANSEGRSPTGWWREQQMRDPCVYCGGRSEELDHILPRSRGGRDGWTNRAPCCIRCNRLKAASGLLLFLTDRRLVGSAAGRPGLSAPLGEIARVRAVQRPGGAVSPQERDARARRPSDLDLRRRRVAC